MATVSRQQEIRRSMLLYRLVKMLARQEWLRISDEERAEIREMEKLLEAVNPLKAAGRHDPLVLLYYFNTLALCRYMLHDTSDGTVYSQKILYLWKTHPELISQHAPLFLNAVKTTSYNDFLSGNISQLKENLEIFKLLARLYLKDAGDLKHFEVIRFNIVLKLLHHAAEYEEIEALIAEKAGKMVRYAEQFLLPSEGLPVIGSVCISYFVLEKWEVAERLAQQLKVMNKGAEQLDVLYFTAVFYPLILYEKKDRVNLKRVINDSLRYLRGEKLLRPFEKKLLSFLKRLAAAAPAEVAGMTGLFIKELDKYSKAEKALYFMYFDYYGWLESKRMKMHYRDYKKMKRSL